LLSFTLSYACTLHAKMQFYLLPEENYFLHCVIFKELFDTQ